MEFEIWQIILLFLASFFAGFIDSIAGGGGLITIPALLAVGIPAHIALATNKLQSSFGSFSASYNFAKKGFVNFKELKIGIIWTFIGATLGTLSVLLVSADTIKFLIPIMLIIIFIYTIFKPNLGEFEREKKMSEKMFYTIFGLLIGFYDGFLGPGTGSFWTIAMLALIGLEMKKAVARTKVLNFISNIVSLSVFILGGQILWLIGIIMGSGQLFGAYLGSTMVVKKEVKFIKTIFLSVVAVTILKLIYDLLS